MATIQNATFKPAAAGPVEILFYAIDPNKRDAFLTFYRTKLLPWLTAEGVDTANLSLIESPSSLQLVFAAPLNSPPWDTILGDLNKFLMETKPVV